LEIRQDYRPKNLEKLLAKLKSKWRTQSGND
jgi:hypothetical protein